MLKDFTCEGFVFSFPRIYWFTEFAHYPFLYYHSNEFLGVSIFPLLIMVLYLSESADWTWEFLQSFVIVNFPKWFTCGIPWENLMLGLRICGSDLVMFGVLVFLPLLSAINLWLPFISKICVGVMLPCECHNASSNKCRIHLSVGMMLIHLQCSWTNCWSIW